MSPGASRLAAPACLLVLAWALYTFNLTPGSLIGDDEGMNLYPAWRVSLGERLYRDVAFDHTPLAIDLGALLFRFTGPSALAAKKLTIAFSLLAAFFTYLTAEALLGRERALLATALLVTDAYWHFFSWFYTSDAFYLAFYLASLYLFVRAYQREDRGPLWLLSGVMAGFSFFSKLFGVFAFGGSLAFLAVQYAWPGTAAARRGGLARGACWFLGGATAAAVLFLAPMASYLDRFSALCITHHRRSYQELGPLPVLYAFYDILWFERTPIAHRLLLFLGLAGVFNRSGRSRGLRLLLACHLAQASIFLVVKLELYARHFLFVLPFLAILAADQLGELWRDKGEPRRMAEWLAGLILLSALLSFSRALPAYRHEPLVRLVEKLARPGEPILAEHWDVPFLARRANIRLPDVPASGNNPGKGIYRLKATHLIDAIQKERPSVVLIRKAPSADEDTHFMGQIADDQAFLRYVRSTYRSVPATGPGLDDYWVFAR